MEKLTKKQKAFIENLPTSDSPTEAGLKAGFSPNTVRNIGRDILASPVVQKSLKQAMEEGGLTSDYLRQKLAEGLESTRVISAIGGKEANGSTVDFVDVPDYATRHKYLETAIKIKGELIDKVDHTSGGKPIPILGGLSVSSNNSNKETEQTQEED